VQANPALAFAHQVQPEIIVPKPRTPDLIELLRRTLEQLEKSQHLPPDDPKLIELKRAIVSAIAELRILKNGKLRAAA
jgi:hypothetical protein